MMSEIKDSLEPVSITILEGTPTSGVIRDKASLTEDERKNESICKSVFSMIKNYESSPLKQYLYLHSIDICTLSDCRGYNALHMASYKCDDTMINFLIDYALKQCKRTDEKFRRWVNKPTNSDGFTPLHIASFKGSIEVISALVDAGADINVVNPQGINMLHIAAQGDQASSIIYFLEAGANINMTDKRGSTPLHWAVYSNSEVAASYLLAHKAQLNLQDNDGNSPLHAAVKYGYQNKNSRIARLLLLQGAKRDIRNGKGKIALHVLYEVSIDGANRELRTQFEKILVYL